MRVLNTNTKELFEFFENIPRYAILSHTWAQDHQEVSYQDIRSLQDARRMRGFAKVEGACQLAASRGFDYIWIDTCCIDKSSSAELTEAINSMYSWYQKSAICIAYLADVDDLQVPDGVEEFVKSRWFTRGWTLQELIAPREVSFYSRKWRHLGDKSKLSSLLSEITGIDVSILSGSDHQSICVARKMFWASRRQTTRTEDMAYCLMGMFGINMPLIYGEGNRSFIRLQEEIIKDHDDQSIFAWTISEGEGNPHQLYGLLADSPRAFSGSGKWISPIPRSHSNRQSTRVTNNSLEIELLMQPQKCWFGLIRNDDIREMPNNNHKRHFLAILDCQFNQSQRGAFPQDNWPCIELMKIDPNSSSDYSKFARVNPWRLESKDLKTDHIVSARFTNGVLMDLTNWMPLSLGFFDSLRMQLEAICHNKIPWKFQKISIAHKPKPFRPLGFRIQILDERISIVYGQPAQRWFSNDDILRRPEANSQSPTTMKYSTAYWYEEVTSVIDGSIKLEIAGRPGRESDYKYLVLGVQSHDQGCENYWDECAWFRFDELDQSYSWIASYKEASPRWPVGTCPLRSIRKAELRATIESLDNTGLYVVSLWVHEY